MIKLIFLFKCPVGTVPVSDLLGVLCVLVAWRAGSFLAAFRTEGTKPSLNEVQRPLAPPVEVCHSVICDSHLWQHSHKVFSALITDASMRSSFSRGLWNYEEHRGGYPVLAQPWHCTPRCQGELTWAPFVCFGASKPEIMQYSGCFFFFLTQTCNPVRCTGIQERWRILSSRAC